MTSQMKTYERVWTTRKKKHSKTHPTGSDYHICCNHNLKCLIRAKIRRGRERVEYMLLAKSSICCVGHSHRTRNVLSTSSKVRNDDVGGKTQWLQEGQAYIESHNALNRPIDPITKHHRSWLSASPKLHLSDNAKYTIYKSRDWAGGWLNRADAMGIMSQRGS